MKPVSKKDDSVGRLVLTWAAAWLLFLTALLLYGTYPRPEDVEIIDVYGPGPVRWEPDARREFIMGPEGHHGFMDYLNDEIVIDSVGMSVQTVVALTLYHEARGEGEEGLRMVASVIWNRAKGDPRRLRSVCLAPKQFSCWNDGHPGDPTEQVYDLCLKIAGEMVRGEFVPATDADHYHADYVNPAWSGSMNFRKQVGRHLFYRG